MDQVTERPAAGSGIPKSEDADIICFCFGVRRADIHEHFRQPGGSYDTLVEKTRVGTKCTACLLDLDLIVDQASGERAVKKVAADNRPEAFGKGLVKVPIDQCNSGFFINTGGVSTIIRFANHGPMFEAMPYSTGYRYSLRLMTDDGRPAAVHRGRMEVDGDLTIDLSKLPDTPPRGWFILSFYPDQEALMGSIRPQIGLRGPNWTTCYHPQYHHYACHGRAIPVFKVNGQFSTSVHMINASKLTTNVVFKISSSQSDYRAEHAFQMGGYNAMLKDLDEAFPEAPENEASMMLVQSDKPIRKHILGYLADGTLSVDHFPDFK
jgi:bacterioferritin-associated ferredoxin